ncbi:MAG: N-acetylmuramoyl-L-alanine amidase [Puia sp.]|nr:N-acetylmuramoyl-L-alanine amidase [Puia sp.]
MKKKRMALLLLCGICCFVSSFDSVTPHTPAGKKARLRTVIIDPGHGGFDTGTKGLFSKEADVALAISLKLGKAIEEAYPDVKVIYTRTTDIMPGNMPTLAAGLNYRAELANKSKGDLFIAIHCDNDGHPAGPFTVHKVIGHKYVGKGRRRHRVPIYESYPGQHNRKGTTVFVWKADRSGFKGQAISERGEGEVSDSSGESQTGDSAAFDMNSPEAKMRTRLYEKKFFDNSTLFASLVNEEFIKSGRVSEGVQQRDVGIRVLQATGMPSVLIETGFLSNVEEEKYLNSEEGQDEVTRNILNALKQYNTMLGGGAPQGDTSPDSSATPAQPK